MLIDPDSLPRIWHWALLGAFLLLLSKILVIVLIVRRSSMGRNRSLANSANTGGGRASLALHCSPSR